MDYSIEKAVKEFDDMKTKIFATVISEIQGGSKIYSEESKNDEDLLLVVDRNSRSNMIAIHEALGNMDINDPSSLERIRELITKQSIYDSIKDGLVQDKGISK